jgi:hypothetical protein
VCASNPFSFFSHSSFLFARQSNALGERIRGTHKVAIASDAKDGEIKKRREKEKGRRSSDKEDWEKDRKKEKLGRSKEGEDDNELRALREGGRI